MSLDLLKEAKELDIPALWLQPGAEDEAVTSFIKENGLEDRVIYGGSCLLVEGEGIRRSLLWMLSHSSEFLEKGLQGGTNSRIYPINRGNGTLQHQSVLRSILNSPSTSSTSAWSETTTRFIASAWYTGFSREDVKYAYMAYAFPHFCCHHQQSVPRIYVSGLLFQSPASFLWNHPVNIYYRSS